MKEVPATEPGQLAVSRFFQLTSWAKTIPCAFVLFSTFVHDTLAHRRGGLLTMLLKE